MTFEVDDLLKGAPIKPKPEGRRGELRFVVVAVLDSGERKKLDQTLTDDAMEAHRLAVQIAACETCQGQYLRGLFGPNHNNASRLCQSGKQPHCTCPVCWG